MIHSIDPYIPYEVNVYAVTIAVAGKALSKVFFTQETGITLLHYFKQFAFLYSSQSGSKH